MRENQYQLMRFLLQKKCDDSATKIQKWYLACYQRKLFLQIVKAVVEIQVGKLFFLKFCNFCEIKNLIIVKLDTNILLFIRKCGEGIRAERVTINTDYATWQLYILLIFGGITKLKSKLLDTSCNIKRQLLLYKVLGEDILLEKGIEMFVFSNF